MTVALRLAASGCQVGSVPQVSRRVALRASDRAVVSIRSDESSEQPSTVDMASTSTAQPPAPANLPPAWRWDLTPNAAALGAALAAGAANATDASNEVEIASAAVAVARRVQQVMRTP